MYQHYLKIAFRNILKKRLYSAINILGLALGITSSMLLYMFISFHLSFDNYHKDASKTYRVLNELTLDKTLYEKGASMGMYQALSGISSIKNAAVILDDYTFTITLNSDLNKRFKEDENVALASENWFKMFEYRWIAGNQKDFATLNTAVITQKIAVKYFGRVNPIGKVLIFDNRTPVKIVGLLADKPTNTDLKSGIYVTLISLKSLYPKIEDSFFTDWGWMNSTTSLYVTLNDEKSKNSVESAIGNLAKVKLGDNSKYYHFWLQPLSGVHFSTEYGGSIHKNLLLTLTLIGVLILIIASINYINITIAQQAKRMVEIGTRKVLGGTVWQLFVQFMTETLLMVGLAILVSIGLTMIILPWANQSLFAQEPLYLLSYSKVAIFLLVLFLVLIVVSGFYPAFMLSHINSFKAFKNEAINLKAGIIRKVLVVFQNAVAYSIIICTFIMVLQVDFLKHTDLGFNRNSVVMIPLPNAPQLANQLLKTKLEEIPQITSFSFCFKAPSSENNRGGTIHYDQRADWEKWPARSAVGDSSYVKTFGLQIIYGRNIETSKSSREYLVNEKLIEKLGLENAQKAIGKQLIAGEFGDEEGTIVGVVRDFNTKSLEVPIEPVIIANLPEQYKNLAVKLNGENLQASLNAIRKNWEEAYPHEVFEYQFLDEQITSLYQKQDLQQTITFIAASVAILISCLGLLGLVSLLTLQRTKEIGIRKVLGSSVISIVKLLSSSFIKLTIIAFLISAPVAWWLMNEWLENFAFRVSIHWWVFVLSGALAIFIAFATISFQTIKAAMANPVKSLRTE